RGRGEARGRAHHGHLIDRILGTGEERRTHRLLAQPAMADPHVGRLTACLEAHLAAQAATLAHGFVRHGDLLLMQNATPPPPLQPTSCIAATAYTHKRLMS